MEFYKETVEMVKTKRMISSPQFEAEGSVITKNQAKEGNINKEHEVH